MYEITSYQKINKSWQAVLSNSLYENLKENRWRTFKSTFNAGFAKGNPPPFVVFGGHTRVDSEMVQQKIVEEDPTRSIKLLWILVKDHKRLGMPPIALQLLYPVYIDYLANLPAEEAYQVQTMVDSNCETLYTATSSNGSTYYRRNVYAGFPESSYIVFEGVMERCNYALLTKGQYKKFLSQAEKWDELKALEYV